MQKDEFLRLIINSIRNDLISRNESFQCLALGFVGNGEYSFHHCHCSFGSISRQEVVIGKVKQCAHSDWSLSFSGDIIVMLSCAVGGPEMASLLTVDVMNLLVSIIF